MLEKARAVVKRNPAALSGAGTARLTVRARAVYRPAVTHDPATARFLRAAVKAGLREQQAQADTARGKAPRSAAITLQRIKASLKKSKTQSQAKS